MQTDTSRCGSPLSLTHLRARGGGNAFRDLAGRSRTISRAYTSTAMRLPGPHTENWDWQMDAACRDIDDTVFFHPEYERGRSRIQREDHAKAICAGCPVRVKCLDHALTAREPYGVWGGLGERERQALLARAPGKLR